MTLSPGDTRRQAPSEIRDNATRLRTISDLKHWLNNGMKTPIATTVPSSILWRSRRRAADRGDPCPNWTWSLKQPKQQTPKKPRSNTPKTKTPKRIVAPRRTEDVPGRKQVGSEEKTQRPPGEGKRKNLGNEDKTPSKQVDLI